MATITRVSPSSSFTTSNVVVSAGKLPTTSTIMSSSSGFTIRFSDPSVPVDSTGAEMKGKIVKTIMAMEAAIIAAIAEPAFAASTSDTFAGAENKLGVVIKNVIDLITTLAEPVLWGYAVLGFLVMINDKNRGWAKVKAVIYAFLGINLLPALFSLLRAIGGSISSSVH